MQINKRTLEVVMPRALAIAEEIAVAEIKRPESIMNQASPEVVAYNKARAEAKEYALSLTYKVFETLINEIEAGE